MTVLNKHRDKIPAGAVYIGRPSEFGNPFVIGKDGTREEVIQKYWAYVHTNDLIGKIQKKLRGKDLVCFCTPRPCHGHVLTRIANAPMAINAFVDEYHFLSNFYEGAPIRTKSGIIYPTSEHAYQAAKSTSLQVRKRIARIADPGRVKSSGRELKIRPDWEQIKRRVMLTVVRAKFKQNPELAMKLIDTLSAELVEGNWWHDQYWGVSGGIGKNWLGKTLMRVRNELRWSMLGLDAV